METKNDTQKIAPKSLSIGEEKLALADLEEVVFHFRKVELSALQKERLGASRRWLEEFLHKSALPIYGINTGFGALSNQKIGLGDLCELQLNLLRSHAVGVGEPLSAVEVRAILLLRAHTLAMNYSGVRPDVIEGLVNFLNFRIHPVVPQRGSVGACGDLAPLAHLSLPLVGEGEVEFEGQRISASAALKKAGLRPLKLGPKEGLSLINGTQAMTAIGALSMLTADRLLQTADIAAALSTDALRGSTSPFDADLHLARPLRGQQMSADNLLRLTQGSAIAESHRNCERVQDPYSLRCVPQVHGAAIDLLLFVRNQIEIEMNSVTDNPLIFPEKGKIVSGGNFHGEPIAMALDCAAIALSEVASLSERRIDKLMNPSFSALPAFLAPDAGINSGLMMVQVSAAALVSENKILSHPASVDSIPTSNDKEDHVSMGVTAALKLKQILWNVECVLAMELIAARQALEFLLPLETSPALRPVLKKLQEEISFVSKDRSLHHEIEEIRKRVEKGAYLPLVEGVIGELRGITNEVRK